MRKFTVLLLMIILFVLSSCVKSPDAKEMLTEFCSLYSASGVIYTPEKEEGEDGYISEELFRRIYIFEGDMPKSFAIFLNSHANYGAECGVFVCDGSEERERIIEMCAERIKLLNRGSDNAFIKLSGAVVLYSTMPDKARAEALWNKIVSLHT